MKSDLRSFREVRDLAVQVSKKGNVIIKVSNVGCVRTATFGEDEWDVESDALSVTHFLLRLTVFLLIKPSPEKRDDTQQQHPERSRAED